MKPILLTSRSPLLPTGLAAGLLAMLVAGGLLSSCRQAGMSRIGGPSPLPAAAPPVLAAPTPTPTPIPARMPIANWARGTVLRKVPVKPGNKVFALTFDDGPWPHSTRKILKILKDKGVHATFFMVGQEVTRRPEIAKEVSEAGHTVGNHSWDHPSRPRDAIAQVNRTDAAIKKATGHASHTFRPPYGLLKNGMAKQAMKNGNPILIWSADSADWKKPGASRIARNIIGEASPGGIALMHDGGGSRDQTIAALPVIIDTLHEKGYRFVTIPELISMRYIAPTAPKKKPGDKAKGKTTHQTKPAAKRSGTESAR